MSHDEPFLAAVTALCRTILNNSALPVSAKHSLTRDLGLDSMHLMQFFAGIEELCPSLPFETWFLNHAGGERDTIGSLVALMAQCAGNARATEAV